MRKPSLKYTSLVLVLLLFFNCKNEKHQEVLDQNDTPEKEYPFPIDTLSAEYTDKDFLDKSITIELKQSNLIKKEDEREAFKGLISDERYVVDKKDYKINFNYPVLNENFKNSNKNFNDFITNYYANVTQVASEIMQSKLLCDSIAAENFREERYIDYKIYIVSDQLVSVLFYKENFYSGAMHPSFSFDCFNFDLNEGAFMTYEDFFVQGSEDELLEIINKKIQQQIHKGELYYECWELSSTDFFSSKNNFVLNDTYLEFYFDDCVMCPSYTGTYSIELPLVELLPVLKKYASNGLVFQ
ncbi:RsiV family protein [Sediminibacter sp. Hel_I_10]|uniref:RsiV family protein n=1 Tax=Sediminibacter sp. Hel_I_10 TaxID=1392490 RepID=UPI00047D27BC|nr:RsiV family protein [Sediminibacter sp. Hel_I_10]